MILDHLVEKIAKVRSATAVITTTCQHELHVSRCDKASLDWYAIDDLCLQDGTPPSKVPSFLAIVQNATKVHEAVMLRADQAPALEQQQGGD